jgi:hypothetical protein
MYTACTNDLEEAMEATPCVEIELLPKRRQFLRGPVDWEDTCTAAALPGKALAVWLLIHLRWRIRNDGAVTLPSRRLAEMGVDRWSKRRALDALEDAGLIRVTWQRGRPPHIALVSPDAPIDRRIEALR